MSEQAIIASAATTPTGDPWLFTPGPLTTSPTVKEAMLHDFGSRDARFIAMNKAVRDRLLAIVNGSESHICIPMQGSGTFVVEAMIGNFVPTDGKLLVLVNGAYGWRIVKIAEYYQRAVEVLETPEDVPSDVAALEQHLARDPGISHVAMIHCETTSGMINPIKAIADVVKKYGRSLLIDAMSAFGALPLDSREIHFDAVVASSNKCLEGVPGMGFCLARKQVMMACAGNSPSLSLDLYEQWQGLEKNGQWRFTPPTHCILALDQALREFTAEGGVAGRGARYRANCQILVEGMRAMGFQTLLPDELQAPIIVTFHKPADPAFDFMEFYRLLNARGYVIYPGKLTVADSFRMGCIGRMSEPQMRGVLQAVKEVLEEFGVSNCQP